MPQELNWNEQILTGQELEDLNTLYNTFPEIIHSIYLTNSSVVPIFDTTLTEIEVAVILNDKFDTENNRLVKLYVKNYLTEHLGSRLVFIYRYMNDPIDPLFYVEGGKLFLTDTNWSYYWMNSIDPIAGEKLNFNIDLLSSADQDYVFYLFDNLVSVKRAYTKPNGDLLEYTRVFYPIILTTYILLNESFELSDKACNLTVNAYSNSLTTKDYKEIFKPDFLELLKKYDIDF